MLGTMGAGLLFGLLGLSAAAAAQGEMPEPRPAAAEAEAEAEAPEEELICRIKRVPSERVGERFRRREICQTREEWEAERPRRR